MITPRHRRLRSLLIWHALLLPSRIHALPTRILYFDGVLSALLCINDWYDKLGHVYGGEFLSFFFFLLLFVDQLFWVGLGFDLLPEQ
jgi:hypothetical protein